MKGNARIRTFWAVFTGASLMAALRGDFPAQTVYAAPKSNPPAKLKVDDTPLPRDVKATSFAPVVKKAASSVVNISSTRTVREQPMRNPLLNDPFFRRFFGPDQDEHQPQRPRRAQSLGSGVIVSDDGYILTANHVVKGADPEGVKVALADGKTEYTAKVVATDPQTEVAVLKVEAQKLPAMALADSDKLEVGDVVLAIGNPFGVGQSVTMGIVSAVGRGGFGVTDYEDWIQTDAAINPGNSGGALVDAAGRLVGINTWIVSESGGSQGVGFAIPVNLARNVMDQMIEHGRVSRGFLGINIQRLTPELAREFNLPDESSGVLVGGVFPKSPAEKAGVQDGDLVLEFNGKKVSDPQNLRLLVSQSAPGTKAPLKILRGEAGHKPAEKTLTVTLEELPGQGGLSRGRGRSAPGGAEPSEFDGLDGVEVSDIDAQTRQDYEVPNNVKGAAVTKVDEDSNAADAGLRVGDVIMSIDRQPVRGSDDAVAMSEKAKGDHILLRVWSRGAGGVGGTRFLTVDNKKRK